MQYVLRLIGQISWEGRENGLPEEIYAYLIVDGNANKKVIDDLIESQAMAFFRAQAMFVQKDQGAIIDIRETPADRMLVPMHWIVNITADIAPMIGELSLPDEHGVERLSDGSEPQRQ